MLSLGRAGTAAGGAVKLDAAHLRRCIASLERAVEEIGRHPEGSGPMYDILRAACVKEFEVALELSGRLLRKRLADWFGSHRAADRLVFKAVFRHAARFDLLSLEAVERWIEYRDNRNSTAHDYGQSFAEATLRLLPAFVHDAKALADIIERGGDD